MSSPQRLILIGAAVVVLVVGFIVLRPSDDDDSGSSTTAATVAQTTPAEPAATTDAPAATTETAPEPEPEPAPEPEPDPIPTIVVRDGQPADGIQELRYEKGDEVDFRVRANTDDNVHVHGYDIAKDVKAGGQTRFRFEATIEGIFEVELHESGAQIAKLEVQP